jgi:hypothetical protein
MRPNPFFADMQYVPAGMLRGAELNFTGLAVETEAHRSLGMLAGVLIDPAARRLRYLVVDSSRWLGHVWRLVPFSATVIDAERGALRVDEASLASCMEVAPEAVLGPTRAAS